MQISSSPFNHILTDLERYKIVNNSLSLEVKKTTDRSSASGWSQFWSRGAYSQTKVLKRMGLIYLKLQINNQFSQLNETFYQNYSTLIKRAKLQNETFKDTCWIIRFFKGKTEIDVSSHEFKLTSIRTLLDNPQGDPNFSNPFNDVLKEQKKKLQTQLDEAHRQEQKVKDMMNQFKEDNKAKITAQRNRITEQEAQFSDFKQESLDNMVAEYKKAFPGMDEETIRDQVKAEREMQIHIMENALNAQKDLLKKLEELS